MTSWQAGTLFSVGTAFCWAMSAMAFESAAKRVGSLVVNLVRLVIALLLLTAFCWYHRGLPLPTDASREAWVYLSLSGFVGFFIGDMALFRAFVVMGARLSTLLMSLAPPMAALIAYLALDERIPLQGWIGMAVTLGGILWVVSERLHDEDPRALRRVTTWGLVLGMIGALGQAAGAVLSKKGMGGGPDPFDPVAATQIRAIAGVVGFILVLGIGGYMPRVFQSLKRPGAMGFMTLGAFIGPFVGVSLFHASLQLIPTGVAQTIAATVPVIIIPFVIVLYREHVTWRAAFGAAVTVIGVAILVMA
jgi:drug/metabolite transporter (DMT)-like permease